MCKDCGLAQLDISSDRNMHFNDEYLYHSSVSQSWLEHCKNFSSEIKNSLALKKDDLVIEIASNDGYLLQFFKGLGIQVLGIEPSRRVAEIAINEKKIPTVIDFFGYDLALDLKNKGISPRLICANNVLAHVPNLTDFIRGLSVLCNDETVITIEFPHFFELISQGQFDTIYHEHYSYFNLSSIEKIFQKYELKIYDVEQLKTHGGSLRIYISKSNSTYKVTENVNRIKSIEAALDPRSVEVSEDFNNRVKKVTEESFQMLRNLSEVGKTVVGYGAAAKGNTFLNFAKLTSTHLKFVVDNNQFKQGKFLPGSHIPVVSATKLLEEQVDFIVILPWNLKEEITESLKNFLPYKFEIITFLPRPACRK